MLGKKILKIAPPSIQKFDLEKMGKLVATVAASEMMREYLIKQKILPEHINTLTSKNVKRGNVDWRSFGKYSSFHWEFLLVFETIQG